MFHEKTGFWLAEAPVCFFFIWGAHCPSTFSGYSRFQFQKYQETVFQLIQVLSGRFLTSKTELSFSLFSRVRGGIENICDNLQAQSPVSMLTTLQRESFRLEVQGKAAEWTLKWLRQFDKYHVWSNPQCFHGWHHYYWRCNCFHFHITSLNHLILFKTFLDLPALFLRFPFSFKMLF